MGSPAALLILLGLVEMASSSALRLEAGQRIVSRVALPPIICEDPVGVTKGL